MNNKMVAKELVKIAKSIIASSDEDKEWLERNGFTYVGNNGKREEYKLVKEDEDIVIRVLRLPNEGVVHSAIYVNTHKHGWGTEDSAKEAVEEAIRVLLNDLNEEKSRYEDRLRREKEEYEREINSLEGMIDKAEKIQTSFK